MLNFRKFFTKTKEEIPADDPFAYVPHIDLPEIDLTQKQKTTISENLSNAHLKVLAVVLFLFPLLYIPGLANRFDLPKGTFLLLAMLLTAVSFLIKIAVSRKVSLIRSPFDLAVIMLPVVALVSAYLTANRVINLVSDPVIYVGAALLFLLIVQITREEKELTTLLKFFLLPMAIISFMGIAQVVGSFMPSFPLALGFSLTGSPLSQAMLLAVALPVALGLMLGTKNAASKVLAVVIAGGLLASLYVLYRSAPVLLPMETGWKIAAGTMGQSLAAAIFGVGPANYIDAFTLHKPIDFNATPLWNLRFTAGANFYFYLLTTVGIAGLVIFAFIAARIVQLARARLENQTATPLEKGLLGSLIVTLIMFVFLPAPAVVIVIFFAVLGLLVVSQPRQEQAIPLSNNSWLNFAPVVAGIVITAFVAFHLGRFFLADYYFARSLNAAAANQGTQTYNYQIQALGLNPMNDAYHVSYSQTNLALADALASQPNLTDQQKQAVIQLVQQAIREGRVAAALSPGRAGNWENLSLIYRSLINFAQGADQWALASLNQAIALDATNPRLRLDLGGIFYAGRDYQSAAQIFNQAISLKPDLANAHYNLAQALKGLSMRDQAIQELQLTASLVCPLGQTADCELVNNEITTLGSAAATPAAEVKPVEPPVEPLATASAQKTTKNLPKAKTAVPVKISSPSGEITP